MFKSIAMLWVSIQQLLTLTSRAVNSADKMVEVIEYSAVEYNLVELKKKQDNLESKGISLEDMQKGLTSWEQLEEPAK